MFLPETPIYLIHKNKLEEAEKSIQIIHGPDFDPRLEVYYNQRKIFERASKSKSSFKSTNVISSSVEILFP